MTHKWILKTGASSQTFDSFPLAFRTMFALAKRAVTLPNSAAAIKGLVIVSPMINQITGKAKVYDYTAATLFAQNMDLIDSEGEFNKKALGFKR